MVTRPPPPHRIVGMPIGYQMVRYLGRGSTGLVVCARQVQLDRLVAIKTIYGAARGADIRARLDREARILARLRHPNIVQVLALIPAGDDLAMVLEFVDGDTWADELARRPGIERIITVLGQVADAMEYLARQRITHRDLKPSNVLIATDGTAKLADFGLSRLVADAAWFRTAAGVGLGTPGYAAPEQVSDPGVERVESDHYAFAAMAFRSLSGELPRPERVTAEALRESGFPTSAAAALSRGLAADPARRLSPVEVMAVLGNVSAEQWGFQPRVGVAAADGAGGPRQRAEGAGASPANGPAAGEAEGTATGTNGVLGSGTGLDREPDVDDTRAAGSPEILATPPIRLSDQQVGTMAVGVPLVTPTSFRPPNAPLYRRISPLLIGFVVAAAILVCVLVLT